MVFFFPGAFTGSQNNKQDVKGFSKLPRDNIAVDTGPFLWSMQEEVRQRVGIRSAGGHEEGINPGSCKTGTKGAKVEHR